MPNPAATARPLSGEPNLSEAAAEPGCSAPPLPLPKIPEGRLEFIGWLRGSGTPTEDPEVAQLVAPRDLPLHDSSTRAQILSMPGLETVTQLWLTRSLFTDEDLPEVAELVRDIAALSKCGPIIVLLHHNPLGCRTPASQAALLGLLTDPHVSYVDVRLTKVFRNDDACRDLLRTLHTNHNLLAKLIFRMVPEYGAVLCHAAWLPKEVNFIDVTEREFVYLTLLAPRRWIAVFEWVDNPEAEDGYDEVFYSGGELLWSVDLDEGIRSYNMLRQAASLDGLAAPFDSSEKGDWAYHLLDDPTPPQCSDNGTYFLYGWEGRTFAVEWDATDAPRSIMAAAAAR